MPVPDRFEFRAFVGGRKSPKSKLQSVFDLHGEDPSGLVSCRGCRNSQSSNSAASGRPFFANWSFVWSDCGGNREWDASDSRFVVAVGDEDGRNWGWSYNGSTLGLWHFVVKSGALGLFVRAWKGEDLERLQLPPMVPQREIEDKLRTAFTVIADAKHGTTTGVSARDRATIALALVSRDSKAWRFRQARTCFPIEVQWGWCPEKGWA